MQPSLDQLKTAIDARNRAALSEVLSVVLGAHTVSDIFSEVVYPALNAARDDFKNRRKGIPELLLVLDMVSSVLNAVASSNSDVPKRNRKIVLGVIEGDIHDMGKNIVRDVYRGYGFDVIDLGKNIPIERFVAAALAESADLVGVSTMMSTTLDPLEKVIDALKKKCPATKVIVGGAFIDQKIADNFEADAYAEDIATLIEVTDGILP